MIPSAISVHRPSAQPASAPAAIPFVWLEPLQAGTVAVRGLAELERALGPQVALVTRVLVQASIAKHNDDALRIGQRPLLTIPALNRRRRAARAWVEAIRAGRIDSGTLHAVAHSWIPLLAGSGPELHRRGLTGRRLVELVRGAITGLVFSDPADNLLPQAHALHALETTLAAHLGAWRDAVAHSRRHAAR